MHVCLEEFLAGDGGIVLMYKLKNIIIANLGCMFILIHFGYLSNVEFIIRPIKLLYRVIVCYPLKICKIEMIFNMTPFIIIIL